MISVQTNLSVIVSSPSLSNFYLNLETNIVFCHLRMFFSGEDGVKSLSCSESPLYMVSTTCFEQKLHNDLFIK